MTGPFLLRRDVLALAGAAPLAGRAAMRGPAACAPVRLANVRLCNTGYYERAVVEALRPGRTLAVAFAPDPGFPDSPSAAFFLDGRKVGDAPRAFRHVLGRLLHAGRRLSAEVESERPAGPHSERAWRLDVSLAPGDRDEPLGGALDSGFGSPAPPDAEVRLRRALPRDVHDLVYLQTAPLWRGEAAPAIGEPLLLTSVDGVGLCARTLDGGHAGVLASRENDALSEAADGGLRLAATVTGRFQDGRPYAAVYSLD